MMETARSDTLDSLYEAVFDALAAVAGAVRLSFDVDAVRQRAEALMSAAGLAIAPSRSREGDAIADPRLALVAAHSAALVAAAEQTGAVEELTTAIAVAEMQTRYKHSLAPVSHPVREARLARAAEAFMRVSKQFDQGNYVIDLSDLVTFRDDFPWAPHYLYDTYDYFGLLQLTLSDEKSTSMFPHDVRLYLSYVVRRLQGLEVDE